MHNDLRTASLAAALLLLAGLSAPTASATTVDLASLVDADLESTERNVSDIIAPVSPVLLCDYNPDAWANACVRTTTRWQTVYAYTLDTTPDTTTVCPLGTKCYNVPVILSMVDPQSYTVYYTYPTASYNVNTKQILEDVCDVIGVSCALTSLFQTTSISMPHGLEFVEEADADADGLVDTGLFSLPSGELVALPFA